jgi:hypothetical protein
MLLLLLLSKNEQKTQLLEYLVRWDKEKVDHEQVEDNMDEEEMLVTLIVRM